MLYLLLIFKQGSSYDEALDIVYGFDMDGLDTLWRDYVTKQYQPAVASVVVIPPALIGVIVALYTAFFGELGLLIRYRIRGRAR